MSDIEVILAEIDLDNDGCEEIVDLFEVKG